MEPPPASPPDRPKPCRKHSGSETRQRTTPVGVRLLPEERAELQAAANAAGLSIGGFIRVRTLMQPLTPARRLPPEDRAVLVGLKAELNRVGGHIYQIAKHLNFGGFPEAGEITAALADYYATSAVIRAAIERGGSRR
jgi:hypothetical protein